MFLMNKNGSYIHTSFFAFRSLQDSPVFTTPRGSIVESLPLACKALTINFQLLPYFINSGRCYNLLTTPYHIKTVTYS